MRGDMRQELRHRIQPLVWPTTMALPSLVGREEGNVHVAHGLGEGSDRILAPVVIRPGFRVQDVFHNRAFKDGHGPLCGSRNRSIGVGGQSLESIAYGLWQVTQVEGHTFSRGRERRL